MSAQSVAGPKGVPVTVAEIRCEVIGSLLRPPHLVDARERHERGELDSAEFKRIEDDAVRQAISLQEEAGIDVITDGEQRRYAFYGHLIDSFDGFDKEGGWAIPFRDESGEELVLRRPVVVEPLRWRRSMCAEEWTFVRAVAKGQAKVTMLSAQQAAAYYDPDKSRGAYSTRDAYLAEVEAGTFRITARPVEFSLQPFLDDPDGYNARLLEVLR